MSVETSERICVWSVQVCLIIANKKIVWILPVQTYLHAHTVNQSVRILGSCYIHLVYFILPNRIRSTSFGCCSSCCEFNWILKYSTFHWFFFGWCYTILLYCCHIKNKTIWRFFRFRCWLVQVKMSAETVLLDLAIDSSRISDSTGQKDVMKLLEQGLLEFFPQLKLCYETSTSDGHLAVFSQNDTIFLHLRFFNHGIITINIEFFKSDSEQSLVSFDVSTRTSIQFTFMILFFSFFSFVLSISLSFYFTLFLLCSTFPSLCSVPLFYAPPSIVNNSNFKFSFYIKIYTEYSFQ